MRFSSSIPVTGLTHQVKRLEALNAISIALEDQLRAAITQLEGDSGQRDSVDWRRACL